MLHYYIVIHIFSLMYYLYYLILFLYLYLYLLSDELKEDALEEYLESLMSEDENGDDVTTPKFIHDDLPLGVDVPKNWLLSNEKHRDKE